MAIQVQTGPTRQPLRILLHGQEGVGKTTWAAGCPRSVVLTCEDGGGDLDYARAVLPSWSELCDAVREMIRDPGDFRTVIIDTIDSYERLLWADIVREAEVDTIEQVGGGYGKGYTFAAEKMAKLQGDLDTLRSKHRMNVILLAHSHVRPFNDPLGAPYDRYEVRMHKGSADLWKGWADAILFACFDVTVMKAGKRGRAVEVQGVIEKGKAVDGAKRVIYTSKEPGYDAKNRHSLPEEIPLGWRPFADAIRWDARDAALTGPVHDPSWEGDRARFCAKLAEFNVSYDDAAAWLNHRKIARPSEMSQANRDKFLASLSDESKLASLNIWISERNAAMSGK